ncbi:MAG: membrane fusion protein (multidrug efflux system) [Candidatus Azotimanducaceae bacterium]|jgi:membrane fusion protein (multidrug efflux system)
MTKTNIFAVSLLVISSLALAVWLLDRSRFVYVSDARVAATMVSVSSRIPGWISSFPVKDGKKVTLNEVLVKIDTRDIEHQVDELEASLNTIDAEFARLQSKYKLINKRANSTINAEQAKLNASTSATSEALILFNQAKKDFTRAESLLGQKMISEAEFEARQSGVDQIQQSYRQALARTETAKAQLHLSEGNREELKVIDKEMEIVTSRKQELLSQKSRLVSKLEDHTIRSKLEGVVDETFANAGEYVYPGQRILMLHNPDEIWIKAYVKETEIQYLALGSTVTISVDAYPDNSLEGSICNIGNAATSQFAMLPSPNPSGNFVKVTQRIEVQVKFEAEGLNLKPGMMVELKINKSDG